MCIPCSCGRLSVPQQSANDWQPQPSTGTKARVSVPEVVQANAVQTGPLCDGIPWALQIVARASRIVAGHHVGPDPLQRIQHGKGRGVEDDSLPAALAVGQEQTATFQVDVLPFQVQDFPEAAASEQKQAERCRRRRCDLGEALGLRHVFGVGPGFVHRPGNANSLGFADRATQSLQLLAGQEPLAAAFFEFVDPPRGIGAFRHHARAARKGVHATERTRLA